MPVREHVEAFNDGNLAKLLAGFTHDALWITGQTTVRGHNDLRTFFAAAIDALQPNLRSAGRMDSSGPWTGNDAVHNKQCGSRWPLHRRTGTSDYPEAWHWAQCGGCRFWIALSGRIGHDYGACTNADSQFDGRVRFEHDGCDYFTERTDGSFG